MKTCTRCEQTKPTADFGAARGYKDGLRSWCKDCWNAYGREWRTRHPERVRAMARASYARHSAKRREDRRRYRLRHPDRIREQNARRKGSPQIAEQRRAKQLAQYGLTEETYSALLAEQDGKCAICGRDEPNGQGKRFHVDHDHETGRRRGLLCSSCNSGLGLFGDHPDVLVAAAAYLIQTTGDDAVALVPREPQMI